MEMRGLEDENRDPQTDLGEEAAAFFLSPGAVSALSLRLHFTCLLVPS